MSWWTPPRNRIESLKEPIRQQEPRFQLSGLVPVLHYHHHYYRLQEKPYLKIIPIIFSCCFLIKDSKYSYNGFNIEIFHVHLKNTNRSEERRVGKECRSR